MFNSRYIFKYLRFHYHCHLGFPGCISWLQDPVALIVASAAAAATREPPPPPQAWGENSAIREKLENHRKVKMIFHHFFIPSWKLTYHGCKVFSEVGGWFCCRIVCFLKTNHWEAPPQVPSHGWLRNHFGYSWRKQRRVCVFFCRNIHHWSLVEPLSLCQKGWILNIGWLTCWSHLWFIACSSHKLPKTKERQSSSWRSMLRYSHTSPQVAPPVRLGMEWNRHDQLVWLNFLALGTSFFAPRIAQLLLPVHQAVFHMLLGLLGCII